MKTLKYYNSKIFGLSEVNMHWPLVELADSWEERISERLQPIGRCQQGVATRGVSKN